MEKKTLGERVSRLKGITQLPAKLPIRLLDPGGAWLAVPCVLAAVLTGYVSLAPICLCDAIASGASSTAPASPSAPRFAPGGPDAEDYGASDGYPIGDRTTFFRTPFLVGSSSHLDQVFEGRLVRRATTPSPLARTASEPTVRYAYRGYTFTLDDYLTRHPVTGLLVAQDTTAGKNRDCFEGIAAGCDSSGFRCQDIGVAAHMIPLASSRTPACCRHRFSPARADEGHSCSLGAGDQGASGSWDSVTVTARWQCPRVWKNVETSWVYRHQQCSRSSSRVTMRSRCWMRWTST